MHGKDFIAGTAAGVVTIYWAVVILRHQITFKKSVALAITDSKNKKTLRRAFKKRLAVISSPSGDRSFFVRQGKEGFLLFSNRWKCRQLDFQSRNWGEQERRLNITNECGRRKYNDENLADSIYCVGGTVLLTHTVSGGRFF